MASVTERLTPASGQAQLDPSARSCCSVCQEPPRPSESALFQGGKRLKSQASVSCIFQVLGGTTSCPCWGGKWVWFPGALGTCNKAAASVGLELKGAPEGPVCQLGEDPPLGDRPLDQGSVCTYTGFFRLRSYSPWLYATKKE